MKRYTKHLSLILSLFLLMESFVPYSTAFAQEIASVSAKEASPSAEILTTLKDESFQAELASLSAKENTPAPDVLGVTTPSSAKIRDRIRVLGLLKKTFSADEGVILTLKNARATHFKVTLRDQDAKQTDVLMKQEEVGDDEVLTIKTTSELKPGRYTLTVEDTTGVISRQSFSWGVLALNPDKSVYTPGETALLAMAVLDDQGEMVCTADVLLVIKDPNGKTETLSTENHLITVGNHCSQKVLTLEPDYQAEYLLQTVGVYTLTLTAHTKNGERTITDTIEVQENPAFQIKRVSATRLYPPLDYPMVFEMTAQEDFTGTVTETVPESFEVSSIDPKNSSINDVISLKSVQAYNRMNTVSANNDSGYVLGESIFSLTMPFKGSSTSASSKEILVEHPQTLGFGEQLDDPTEKHTYQEFGLQGHDGIDFAAKVGTPVVTVDAGKVVLAEENGDYGKTVVIEHSWGKSYYGHLSSIGVVTGQTVEKGIQVGLSGSSGVSTGPHLHFGIKLKENDEKNGYYGKIDPAPYLGIPTTSNVLGAATSSPEVKEKVLVWNIIAKKGQTVRFGYVYKAPNISPQFYTLGPAKVFTGDSHMVYEEHRAWQLAADASTAPVVGFFSPPALMIDSSTSTLNLPQPDPRSGDLLIAAIGIRPSSATVNTPSGWTALYSNTGTDGAGEGADTGSVGLYWFYKVANGTEGTATQAFTASTTPSVWGGHIMQARSATGTYSVSGGGYALNGDVTGWGGTLDTDIGLRSGDLVLMVAAQNGNPANSSAQNISATNVNVKKTGNEHGEFSTNTGNDLELDLASSYIWEGNNTDTPTVATTMSAAASGVSTAVRIRQGSGTNRTDTWVRAAGKQIAGTTSMNVTYPEHDTGDLLVLFAGSRGSSDPTINAPAGWTSLGTYSGGAGSWAADSGNARVAAFYQQVNSRHLSGSQTVTVTNGLVSIAQMLTLHKDDLGGWEIDSDGGTDNSGGASWSTTGSGIDLSSSNGGDILLALSSINTDGQTYSSHSMSASGMTFGDVTETAIFTSTTSNQMTLEASTGRVTAGSNSTVAPTFTMTAGGSTANSPAGATLFVKVKGTDMTTSTSHVGFFSPERVWTSSATTSLALRQPDPRNGDLMVAMVSVRPSSATVSTPSGWTALDSRTGTDGGAEGVSTGSVGTYVFYKVADGSEGTANQTFTLTGSPSVSEGTITQFRSATGTYSLSAGGYSVNGDATAWSSSLDTDIGLTQGDLVLFIAAQNGNLANTSAWDVSATGVTLNSTVTEHGEFSTTTGNDMEVDVAEAQIFEGTNTATPVPSVTLSAASSGTFTAVRVRQGSGTNRTDTWVRSAGAQVIGTTSLATPYPDHEIGDMLILFVGNRDSTDPTPTLPDGWTSLGTYLGGKGTLSNDSGNARINAYYKEATTRQFGTQTVAITVSNTAATQIISIHRDNVSSWSMDVDGGSDNTNGTAWSVTGTGIDLDSANGGDIVLVGSAMNTDAALYSSQALSASGITFGDVTETSEYRSGTGNDMTLEVVTSRVTAGSATGVAPTYTATASTSSTNYPTGASMFIKLIGNVAGSLSFTQNEYQWYTNANALQPGASLANENTSASIFDLDNPVRLRTNIAISGSDLSATSQQFVLQYATSTSGPWMAVGGSGEWCSDETGVTCTSSWGARRKVTFDNSNSGENLVDVPVLVALDSSTIDYSKTQGAGQDLRFVDPDDPTTVLPHEIESWNESGTSYVWVKVPQIDTGSTTDYVWMYYDNAGAADGQAATSVWDSNYQGVWHLGDTPTGSTGDITDSSVNGDDGTSSGGMSGSNLVDSPIGKGLSFDGLNDRVSMGIPTNLQIAGAFSLSFWMYSIGSASDAGLAGTGLANYSCTHHLGGLMYCYVNGGSNNVSTAVSQNAWNYVTFTWDGTTGTNGKKVYVNGTLAAQGTSNQSAISGWTNFELAHDTSYYQGYLDEVRVSNTNRSADWIEAQYLMMHDNGDFNTVSDEEVYAIWTFSDNASVSDGATISTTLLTSSDVGESYTESNPTATNPNALAVGENGEWDFTLNPQATSVGTTYYFRMVEDDGTSLTAYTNYPEITITDSGPVTVNLQVSQNSDDAYQVDGSTTVDISPTGIVLGTGTAANTPDKHGAFRFTGGPSAGATVSSAVIQLRKYTTDWITVNWAFWGEAADNCSTFSNGTGDQLSNRPKGSQLVVVSDNIQRTDGTWYSWDITDVVQEVVSRSGFGGNICIYGVEYGGGSFGNEDFYDYNQNAASAAKLDITYTAASSFTPTLSQLMRHGTWFNAGSTPVRQPFTF